MGLYLDTAQNQNKQTKKNLQQKKPQPKPNHKRQQQNEIHRIPLLPSLCCV